MDFGICLEESSRALPGDVCADSAAEPEVQVRDQTLLDKFLSNNSGKFRMYVLDFFEPSELFRLLDEQSSTVKLVMQASVKSSTAISESIPAVRTILKAYLVGESLILALQHTDSRTLSKLLSTEVQQLLAGVHDVVVLSSESVAEFRSRSPVNLGDKLFAVSNSFSRNNTESVSTLLPSPNVVKYGAAFFLTQCEMLGKPSKALIHYVELNEVPNELRAFLPFIKGSGDLKDIYSILPKLTSSSRMNSILSSNLFV